MTPTIHALLVGIDAYRDPVRPLHGCVNDITSIAAFLKERVGGTSGALQLRVLTDGAATRQAVIDGFREHLGQAKSGDVALFYYSGHGSQEQAPPEFWHLEPDRQNETLVCYDSRTNGQRDLADKELAKLIADVAVRDVHVVMILDCCHAGSGTRSDNLGVRRAPTDQRIHPIESYLVTPEQATSMSQTRGEATPKSGWAMLPQGHHILMAACRADEESKECRLDVVPRGLFSFFLTNALQRTGPALTYRDLFKQVNALVRNNAALQSPQLEATDSEWLDQPFLGGAVQERSPYFTLSYSKANDSWTIDGGAVHGIPPVADSETTALAVFPLTSTHEHMSTLATSLGEAHVTAVQPNQSKVTLTFREHQPDHNQTFRAIVTALPLAPMRVFITGAAESVVLAQQALHSAGPGGTPSLLVREAPAEHATLVLQAVEHGYRIMRPADNRALVADIPDHTAASAAQAIKRLEHIARWQRVSDLSNPTSRIADAIRMEVYTHDPASTDLRVNGTALELLYTERDGTEQRPQIRIKLTNTSDRPLYCALVDLSQTYEISTGLLAGGSIRLEPGQAAWALNGKPIYAFVPDELWEQGQTTIIDILKLIASTGEFDARLLNQPALDMPNTKSVQRSSTKSALDRLMSRIDFRGLSGDLGANEVVSDWSTQAFTFTTVRPLVSTPIPRGTQAPLGAGVTIGGHPSLQAHARLTTVPQASREVGVVTLPALLRDNPEVTQPFTFSASRGGEPGLSVLELSNVVDHTVVRPEQPLVVQIETPLAEHEHVLPFAYDGEFFLPLGYAKRHGTTTEIVLQRLPVPANTRSLSSSIRILFQKIISERTGSAFRYPILAAVAVANDETVTYTADVEAVRERVAAAHTIVLYIHGIIGDTRSMAASARGLGLAINEPLPTLADHYDLILTFDYENVNTSIKQTARALKQRLAQVGLGADRGKQLDIVAHSMGGLVSRWLIEHEAGNQIVQHLVMLGTPNNGSPWPSMQDWATTALGIGLNMLGSVAWPAHILGGLVGAIEHVDVALDEMAAGSELLTKLATSDDPQTLYTIIAGNTSLISSATPDMQTDRLARLLSRLSFQHVLHHTTAMAFFNQPNDIAVAVDSITSIPINHTPSVEVHQVTCDHMTYFTTEAGLRSLANVLGLSRKQDSEHA